MIDLSVRHRPLCEDVWASLPAPVMVSSTAAADSLIAKFKEAANGLRWLMLWVTAIISASGYLHHRSSARGLLIITVITPRSGKAQRDKMPENPKLANAAITDMQMRQRDVAALDAKYTKLSNMLKMMLCVMMLPLVVVGWALLTKQSVSQCVKLPPPPAWIMRLPPTGRHRWMGLFHPQREADHYAKTTGRNPEVY